MGISISSSAPPRPMGGIRRRRVRVSRLAAAAPAPSVPAVLLYGRALRSRGGGKRRFRGFSVSDAFSESDPDGDDGPGLELSIHAFSLSQKKLALGMDEGRKKAMRRLLWYWQFSRDWDWRQVNAVERLQKDFYALNAPIIVSYAADANKAEKTQWYWRWRRRLMQRKFLKQPRALLRAKLLRDKLLWEVEGEDAGVN